MYTLAHIEGTEAYNWGTEFAPIPRGVSVKAGWYVCSVEGSSHDKRGVERTHIKVVSELKDKVLVFKILNIKLGSSDGIKLLFEYEHLLPEVILTDVRYQSLKALCEVVPYETGLSSDRDTLAFYGKISNIVVQEFLRRVVSNIAIDGSTSRISDTKGSAEVAKIDTDGSGVSVMEVLA